MQQVDWNAPAKLIERTDDGSDMHFDFRTVDEGTTGALIARVAALTPSARSRLLIDRGAAGMLTVAEILALVARDDFPTEED